MEGITKDRAILAFQRGVRYKHLQLKLGLTRITSMRLLLDMANKYANGEEDDRFQKGEPQTSRLLIMGRTIRFARATRTSAVRIDVGDGRICQLRKERCGAEKRMEPAK